VHPSVFGLGKADSILGDPTPSRAGREISETARSGKPVTELSLRRVRPGLLSDNYISPSATMTSPHPERRR
jgi:hypothetical protein